VTVTLSDAFEISTGYPLPPQEMGWPNWKHTYAVREHLCCPKEYGSCDRLHLFTGTSREDILRESTDQIESEPKLSHLYSEPISGWMSVLTGKRKKRTAAGTRNSREPRGAPSNFVRGVINRTDLSAKCIVRTSLNTLAEFIFTKEGKLEMWIGNHAKYAARFIRGGTVGAKGPPVVPVAANVNWARRDDLPSSQRVTANDIEDYLSEEEYPNFWRWFHIIALRGAIKAAPNNSGRNLWFFKHGEDDDVRLNAPATVGDLTRFLGGAYWADRERTKMSFTGVFDAKFLAGTVRDGGHLQEWIDSNEENRKSWPESKMAVPFHVKIGQPDNSSWLK